MKAIVDRIKEIKSKYGLRMQPPATEKEIALLKQKMKEEHGIVLPSDYVEMIQISNGLEFSGLRVYGSHTNPIVGYSDRFIEGLLEANAIWWKNTEIKHYLFLGEDDLSLYGLNSDTGEFEELDRTSLDLIETYPTFSALISNSVEVRIDSLES